MIIEDEEIEDNLDDFEEEEEFEEECDSETSDDLPEVVREDKIFNNRYNTGDGLPDLDEYKISGGISVSQDYSDSYLKDIYEYEDSLESNFILDVIFKFIQEDPMISEIIALKNSPFGKIKLAKDEINFIFTRINESLDLSSNQTVFYSPIYILEVLSSITSVEYKKLFDVLSTETQEILLVQLNKKYHFLDGKMHKKKIY